MANRNLAALALITCACLEPPELDELSAPLADLGGVDTWGPLDGAPIPSFDDEGTSAGADGPGEDSGAAPADNPSLVQLRITEILVDPKGKDGGADSPEFIELQNTGAEVVDLSGLRIDAQSWPVLDADELELSGLELAPGAFLVIRRWATDVDPGLASASITPAITSVGFLHSGGLRNADGRVAIGSASEIVDEFVYGVDPARPSSGWAGAAFTELRSGQSVCRSDPSADHDDASDWSSCVPNPGQASPEGSGGEPLPSRSITPGAIQIVEVSTNPPGPASEEKPYEFIEIVNLSNAEVELSGATIGDAPSADAPGVDPLEYFAGDGGCESLTCLAPGARALIVGQGYAGPIGLGLVLTTDDSTIADGGLTNTEPVVLWDPSGVLVSSYRLWPDPSGEPLPADEQPLHRIEPSADDAPLSWVSAPASPGE
ncbi:hypothetical protein ENSA5_32270 [Enhygromyxa salina]|uniref:LTD domain-containing protein n=1 Tax=Enhygromyxa salina TaxID=215803 RepID=A0A2S9XXM9_9BACT|nr:lamin tail domain-containing protein [Enhygromyxa salina]PRP97629.1 hypothetical protein ENSA5_32270 [Enhygromyxa salina]